MSEKDNIQVINFSEYKLPVFRETGTGRRWITFGEKDNYPYYLIGLYSKSAKHGAIVSGKAQYIAGAGFGLKEEIQVVQTKADIENFLDNANPMESQSDIAKKAALDLELFNGFALHLIYNLNRTKIVEVYHVDFSKIRSNRDRTHFWFCNDWENRWSPWGKLGFREFDAYDPNATVEDRPADCLLYYAHYRPDMKTYPLPDYLHCTIAIETDYEIANFHLNNIRNGFWGSFLISFLNGIPEPEIKERIEKDLYKKFGGSGNAGKAIIDFAEGKDRAAQLSSLTPPELDKLFSIVNDMAEQAIFAGHKVTSPMLFGIKTEGQLGGRTELVAASELFQNIYVSERQSILEQAFNAVFKFNDLGEPLALKRFEPVMDQFSEATLVQIMPKNEIRAKAGLPPLPIQTAQEVVDAINTLSPLVANKVLESMTADEIRSIVGLQHNPNVPAATPSTPPAQFNKEDDKRLIGIFKKYGRPASEFISLRKRKIGFSADTDFEMSEQRFLKEYISLAKALSVTVTDLQAKVLSILRDDPSKTVKQISKELNADAPDIKAAVDSLEAGGYIETSGETITITETGRLAAPPPEPQGATVIEIAYSYDVAPGLGPLKIDTTRDFCSELIDLDRKYTRSEIEQISSEAGYSVWAYRGGFYHNPKNNETTPYCRHIWAQEAIIKRR